MKRRLALGAVIAAVALMALQDSAMAGSCRSFGGRSFGYSSYRPSYSYGYSNSYYRPSYNYGYGSYYRPGFNYGYSRPGITFSFSSGRSGFGFGRSYGHSGFSRRGYHYHR